MLNGLREVRSTRVDYLTVDQDMDLVRLDLFEKFDVVRDDDGAHQWVFVAYRAHAARCV